jgi:gamma-glutamylcyclotransferase (GGCT)/AIG2-like uncharacterized protein YtfP
MKVHKLAVYGTLKRGQYNHDVLDGAKWIGAERVPGFVMLHHGGFPAAARFDRRCAISVEVYELDDKVLARCDKLEGTDSGFYKRIEVESPIYGTMYMYIQTPTEIPLNAKWVPCGDWLGRQQYTATWLGTKDELIILDNREKRLKEGKQAPVAVMGPPKPIIKVNYFGPHTLGIEISEAKVL